MVAVDHSSGRVWPYALPDKSIAIGTGWIQKWLARGISNVGRKDVEVIIKIDKENRMVAFQHEIERIRGSNSNQAKSDQIN